MDLAGSLDELQSIEAECLRRFRARARKLMVETPGLKRDIAFARAVEQMPRTAYRYQYTRHLLAMAGVRALPLFE
jgi:hypothetical protein